MKIVSFQSGLGNQIFQYAFYLYLKNRHKNVYPYYVTNLLNDHYGFELNKVLEQVDLKKTPKWINSVVRIIVRFFPKWSSNSYQECSFNILYKGFYFNKEFYDSLPPNSIQLNFSNLSDTNKNFLRHNNNRLLVSIHFRRGDYLNNTNIYGNICTKYYYREAIQYINDHFSNVLFVIFSDEIEYVRENFEIENSCYVNWNQKEDSYMDMLLMASCPINIIANSSFSYWAARLNPNSLLVIYPSKWWAYPRPDIFPDDWVGLASNDTKRGMEAASERTE